MKKECLPYFYHWTNPKGSLFTHPLAPLIREMWADEEARTMMIQEYVYENMSLLPSGKVSHDDLRLWAERVRCAFDQGQLHIFKWTSQRDKDDFKELEEQEIIALNHIQLFYWIGPPFENAEDFRKKMSLAIYGTQPIASQFPNWVVPPPTHDLTGQKLNFYGGHPEIKLNVYLSSRGHFDPDFGREQELEFYPFDQSKTSEWLEWIARQKSAETTNAFLLWAEFLDQLEDDPQDFSSPQEMMQAFFSSDLSDAGDQSQMTVSDIKLLGCKCQKKWDIDQKKSHKGKTELKLK